MVCNYKYRKFSASNTYMKSSFMNEFVPVCPIATGHRFEISECSIFCLTCVICWWFYNNKIAEMKPKRLLIMTDRWKLQHSGSQSGPDILTIIKHFNLMLVKAMICVQKYLNQEVIRYQCIISHSPFCALQFIITIWTNKCTTCRKHYASLL